MFFLEIFCHVHAPPGLKLFVDKNVRRVEGEVLIGVFHRSHIYTVYDLRGRINNVELECYKKTLESSTCIIIRQKVQRKWLKKDRKIFEVTVLKLKFGMHTVREPID
jgi:hypothetical protein